MKGADLVLGFIVFVLVLYVGLQSILFNENIVASLSENQTVAKEMVRYVKNGQDYTIPLTQEEQIHMKDVHNLFLDISIRLLIILIAGFILLVYKIQKQTIHRENTRAIFNTAATLCIFMSIAVIGIVLTFKHSFLVFHKLAFSNNYWLLPADSILIQAFPTTFFASMVIALLLYMALLSAVLLLLNAFMVPKHESRV